MNIINVNKENFDKACKKGTVIADFWAPWCGPCRMLAPVLEEIATEHSDVTVLKINVDDEPDLASRFGIVSIPTVFLFKDGKQTSKFVGYADKEEICKEFGI